MKTVQMTLDDDLVEAVDQLAAKLGTTRSALTRDALRDALARQHELALEAKHAAGYRRKPVRRGEFSIPDADHAWGDE